MATRRTAEFQREVMNLVDALESDTLTGAERVRIAEIMRVCTTDNACMVKVTPLEPVFVLRANDPLAAAAVGYWCDLYAASQEVFCTKRVEDLPENLAEVLDHNSAKLADARKIARSMASWQKQGEKIKVSDRLNV